MKNNSIQLWSLAVVLLLTWQSRAWAHAFLDHAEPKVGSSITNSPAEIKIWFTQNLEAAFSSVRVEDSHGKEVDKKDARVDSKTKSLLVVALPKLPPGVYTVTWHVVSVDTHKTQGHFEFIVK